MEKLNVEKEMLKFDLESLRLNQQNVRFQKPVDTLITESSFYGYYIKA